MSYTVSRTSGWVWAVEYELRPDETAAESALRAAVELADAENVTVQILHMPDPGCMLVKLHQRATSGEKVS